MTDEELGKEVTRLWQRAVALNLTAAQFGRDIDKLMCWGPESERAKNPALGMAFQEKLARAAAWRPGQ